MLEELSTANVDNLQGFITKYQSQVEERNKLNRELQNKKEILYTFITLNLFIILNCHNN